MDTQVVGTNEVSAEINATGTIDTSNLKVGKARKQIDDEAFLNAWLDAAGKKLTLSQFVDSFSKSHDYNAKSVEQKYYKWRKDLTKSLESQTDPIKKTNTENFLKISTFADGRIGVKHAGAGRKKIDRAQTLQELMAKMGDIQSPIVNSQDDENLGQTVLTVNQGPTAVGV